VDFSCRVFNDVYSLERMSVERRFEDDFCVVNMILVLLVDLVIVISVHFVSFEL